MSGSWGIATTDLPVALAVYNGDLYATWAPSGTLGEDELFVLNGSSGLPSATVPSLPSKRLELPALVVYQSELYLFWVAQGGGTGYSTYNGSAWTSATSVSGTWGSTVPVTGLGVAACDGDLFAAWVNGFSTAEQSIRSADFDGTTWSKPVLVPGTKAVLGAPVLGASGDAMYLAWGKYLINEAGTTLGTAVLVTDAENVGLPPPPPPK